VGALGLMQQPCNSSFARLSIRYEGATS
jgi:hypothetical protein